MVAVDPSKSSSGLSGGKRCTSCGTDVTGKKRMKDSKGVYWCYDCGMKDQASKAGGSGSAMTITCPACNKLFPPIEATKQGNVYVCPDCARKKLASQPVMKSVKAARGRATKTVRSSDEEAAQRKKLFLCIGIFAVVGGVIALQYFKIISF